MSEVKIEVAEGTISGGFVPWLKEKYPFSKLTNAEWLNETKTALKGPSFVIAKADNPPSVLAAGRKRLKHCVFVSRKVSENGDVRVWLHPDSPLPNERPPLTETGAKAGDKKASAKRGPKPAASPAAAAQPAAN